MRVGSTYIRFLEALGLSDCLNELSSLVPVEDSREGGPHLILYLIR